MDWYVPLRGKSEAGTKGNIIHPGVPDSCRWFGYVVGKWSLSHRLVLSIIKRKSVSPIYDNRDNTY